MHLISLKLTVAASASGAAIQKKTYGSGTTTLIIPNEKMEDIMRIVKSFEESGLLIKDVSEAIQNKAQKQISGFLSMLFGNLGASLLGNLSTGKGAVATNQGRAKIKTGEGTIKAGEIFKATPSFN